MEFSEVVRRRRMVRRYQSSPPVPRDTIDRLLAAATRAPSAGFSQGWHFLVLDDSPSIEGYWTSTTEPQRPTDRWLEGMRTAPTLIVVFSDRSAYEARYRETDKVQRTHAPLDLEDRWPVPYWHLDAAMAALLILLAATDIGLGACLFGVPAARVGALCDRFGVPAGLVPVATISLGQPETHQTTHSGRRRRPLAEVVSYGSFGSTG